ncbi:FCD domain-containing protein [Fulvimarina endophytica]|uniref:FCD domain-containing protein n=2 Tax=Fulvimarina endophytica TaxID=2293836 RepID=A0A371X0I9_9HYPH|nr:FCD domain-containing protein [Fulvimarina endophytica]
MSEITRRPRRPIKRRRMHEEMVELISHDIREGVYVIGDELPSERELMEEFGISRLTVREGVAALESRGLILTRQGMRARVAGPKPGFVLDRLSDMARLYLVDPKGLDAFMDVREIVEVGTARKAAKLADETAILRLQDVLERNSAARGDVAEFGRTDIEFHRVIADITGNPILVSFYQAAAEWLEEVRSTSLKVPGQTQRAFEAHEKIFAAIKARDTAAAGREMSEHLLQLASIYPPREPNDPSEPLH